MPTYPRVQAAAGVVDGPSTYGQMWTAPAASSTLTGTLTAWTVQSVDCTAGAGARTLPAANSVAAGTACGAKKSDTTANALVVSRAGSDLIFGTGSGSTSKSLTLAGEAVEFVSNGVDRWTVRSSDTPSGVLSTTYAQPGIILSGSGIDPTGATDSTTAIQAKINSVAAGGSLYIPPGVYKISAALNIPTDMSIIGAGIRGVGGTTDTPSGIVGTVIVQSTAATDVISATGQRRVNMRDFGVKFANAIQNTNTGHGFKFDVSASAGSNSGICDSLWSNLYVFGHDGNHYGFWWNCPLLLTTEHLRSFGGGGFYRAQTGNSTLNVGNDVHTHPVCIVSNAGTAAGFATEVATGKICNFSVFIRPQCNMNSGSSTQHRWNDNVGAVAPTYQTVVQPDLESGSAPAPSFASDTTFVGRVYAVTNYDQPVRVGALALSGGNTSAVAVAVGYQALNANTSGDQCTAVGYKALAANTTGSYSTAIGYQALIAQNSTATHNTAVGRLAGLGVTTGFDNTLIGSGAGQAGTAITTGGDNTLIGYQAQVAAVGALQTVAVGSNAKAGNNNATALGAGAQANGNGSVAIGRDQGGTATTTSVQNEIALGTSNHQVKISKNTTGSGSAALGANCPATTATAPYTWFQMTSSDGSTVYVPAWK